MLDAETESQAVAAIGDFAEVQALLVQMDVVPFPSVREVRAQIDVVEDAVTGERPVRTVLVAELRPATELVAVALERVVPARIGEGIE